MDVHKDLAQAIHERDEALRLAADMLALIIRANRVLEGYANQSVVQFLECNLELINRVKEQEARQKANSRIADDGARG